nr:phosphotransferase [Kineosporia babensis]
MQRYLDAQHTLEQIGARAAHIYLTDATQNVAVVEDLTGGTLETLYATDPATADTATRDLAKILQRLRKHHSPTYGTLEQFRSGITPHGTSCEQLVLDRALADLDESARREPRIAAVREELAGKLKELRAAVSPRAEYCLIHGELGPDHVLVSANAEAVLIDVEGMLFFDVEWEHVFLEIRFNERYPLLRELAGANDLDENRLRLYRLAMRLSLVAGPLRLLDGDFPHREGMQNIAEWNTQAALALLNA